MKMFVYSMREYDELPMFEKYAKQYGVEFDYCTEFPGPDNYHLAKGYDALSILTTPTPASMIDVMKDYGIKVISTRTIGYDHVDVKHAHEVGMGVCNVTYDPAAVADYTIMLMLIACRKMRYIMDKANVQDYTLKGKIGKEISKSTVGVIGTGRIGKTVIKHLTGFGCKIY
ncbi:MAG: lactate dehydrogenase, partial [Clostridia bacterium]|nr:lactate dehydrogenase [Clostridia bacterium]